MNLLQGMFAGSPDSFFETTSPSYLEQYTTNGRFNDPVYVFAVIQSIDIHRTQYFPERPR